MAIEFNQATCGPLRCFSAFAPDGTVTGVIGENGSGKETLLRLAAGLEKPVSGSVLCDEPVHCVRPGALLEFPAVRTLLIEHAFATQDAIACARAQISLERVRRGGATALVVSHDESLLLAACDDLWWLRDGTLGAQGSPAEVLESYRRYAAERLRDWGQSTSAPLCPSMRRGDGRARIVHLETIGKDGKPTMVWASGEPAGVRATVRFEHAVDDPVVGMMIRNRIGMEVYGTNTLLEKLKLGPRQAGDTIRVSFGFNCDLCPQTYTLTVASHDPNGLWHDWIEDAVTFLVTDTRYEAGVANLRARVSFEEL